MPETVTVTPEQLAAGMLILRVLVGVPLSLHGFQKLFGWFGGGGLDATARWFASLGFGGGRVAAVAAGAGEILGGLGLALGLLTPVACAAIAGVMTTAALVNNADAGFWSVRKGWELNGYLIVVAWAVAVIGPGRWSADHLLSLDLAGVIQGSLLVLVGVLGGWLRWVSRERASETEGA